MALQPRTQYGKFDGREVRVRIVPGTDYEVRATFEDREDDNPERWLFGIDSNGEATLLSSTDAEDLVADPEPPEWVRSGLKNFDIRLEGDS